MPERFEFDLAVFQGRFQLFHEGHRKAALAGLELARKLLVLIGSSNRGRDTRNPFTYAERREMVLQALLPDADARRAYGTRLDVAPLPDHPYDQTRWIETVQHKVAAAHEDVVRPRICLIGHKRDASSEYLNWFPQWTFVPSEDTGIEASHLRRFYFEGGVDFHAAGWRDTHPFNWGEVCPPSTIAFADTFRGTDHYARLMREFDKEKAYRTRWGKGPFLAADAIIVQSGHVATVRRRADTLGGGMLALPGGFKEPGEPLVATSRREAVEETNIFCLDNDMAHLPLVVRQAHGMRRLSQFYVAQRTFDDPYRSRRGDITTQGVLYKLPDGPLEPLLGADDVDWAGWKPISEVRGEDFFEDHAFIVDKMLNLLP